MNLQGLMDRYAFGPDDLVCFAVGTDGLKPGSNHVMSVGYMPAGVSVPQFMFLGGANAGAVVEYTGITTEEYALGSVGPARALELLGPVFKDKIGVSYTVRRFMLPFLTADLPALKFRALLDIVELYRFLTEIPDTDQQAALEGCGSVVGLSEAIRVSLAKMPDSRLPAKFDQMYSLLGGPALEPLAKLKQKPMMVRHLLSILLTQ